MKVYSHLSIGGLSTFHLCGESKKDRLHAVNYQQSTRRGKAPIGDRLGLFVHSGPTLDSPIIAAAAEELLPPYKYIAWGPNSDITLLDPPNANGISNATTETCSTVIQ
jgi:hypothetical protein